MLLTNKDSDRGGAHEAANHNGSAIAAICRHAAGEVIGLGVHKAWRWRKILLWTMADESS